jgi:hypothetical protein
MSIIELGKTVVISQKIIDIVGKTQPLTQANATPKITNGNSVLFRSQFLVIRTDMMCCPFSDLCFVYYHLVRRE